LSRWCENLIDKSPKITTRAWQKKAKYVFDLLLLAVHLSAGAPASATEIGRYRIRNSNQEMRNIYFWEDSMCILTHYNNNSSSFRNGKRNVIARFTDARTGFLLKSYLLLVRPVFETLLIHGTTKEGVEQNEEKDNIYVFLDMNLYGARRMG